MDNWNKHISQDPGFILGKYVITGTGISVDLILEKLAYGYSTTDLLEAYPHLSAEEIKSCLLFAEDNLRKQKLL